MRPIVWSQGEQRPQLADPEFCLASRFPHSVPLCLGLGGGFSAIDYLNDNDEDDCPHAPQVAARATPSVPSIMRISGFFLSQVSHRPSRIHPAVDLKLHHRLIFQAFAPLLIADIP